MEKSLFRYIWRHSKRDQLIVFAVVLASLPFYFASLDLPRRIVNEAIQGKSFAQRQRDRAVSPALPRLAGLARRRPCQHLRGLPGRSPDAAVRLVGAVPVLRAHQRRLQVLDQRRQGRARRAHAAPDALRPVRAGSALHAGCASQRQVLRDRDHRQGRGRADRRLHRRRVHHCRPFSARRPRPRSSSSWSRISGSA